MVKAMAVALDKEYGKLLANVQPRVIMSEEDHLELSACAEKLMTRTDRTSAETKLLKLLIPLIKEWERKNVSIPKASPREVLKYLIEQGGRNSELKEVVDKATLSKILAGRRGISKELAKRLGELYRVSPAVFI